MNDVPDILGGAGVAAWLTLAAASAQSWIGLAVGILTLAVLIQRLMINYRSVHGD